MLYGSETWILNKTEERKVEAFEMWCYRRSLRTNWTQRRTNESVLQEIGENRSILTTIQRRRTS